MENVCNELIQFMQPSSRLELKLTATKNVLSLTGSPEGRKFIIENHKLLEAILTLTKDEISLAAEDSYLSLINLSTEEAVVDFMLNRYDILPEFFRIICDSSSKFSDHACMIISNLSRHTAGSEQCLKILSNNTDVSLSILLSIYSNVKYNKMNCKLDYIGPIFANLTQLPEGRDFFLKCGKNIQKMISFMQYKDSVTRRGAAVSVIRNCCFNYDKHDWLLSDDIDLLPHLLLPLAGPEEFDENETDKLPLDLQYLPSNKLREEDIDIRKLLIECLLLLCASQSGFEFLKSHNTQLIITELQKWEKENKNQDVIDECEKLLQVLTSDKHEE